MTRIELRTMIRELYFYFRLKEPANSDQIDAWAKDLQYINPKAVDFIKDELKKLDNLPRNLPKIIRGIYAQYTRQNKSNAWVKYDLYDDVRYPVENLQTAFEIFMKSGEDAFNYYCKTNYH